MKPMRAKIGGGSAKDRGFSFGRKVRLASRTRMRLAAVRCIRAGTAFVLAFLRETCVQQCGHGTNKCIG
jgi:hypothetical protein